MEKHYSKDFDLNYMKIITELMSIDHFMYAWLCSDFLFEDLENIFFIHMPSQYDWENLV